MSALVCGKRSAFEDIANSSPPSVVSSKRARFRGGGGGSPSRVSQGGEGAAVLASGAAARVTAEKLALLATLFTGMDAQILTRVLEECGDDIDSAIRSLNLLKLAPPAEPSQVAAAVAAATAAAGASSQRDTHSNSPENALSSPDGLRRLEAAGAAAAPHVAAAVTQEGASPESGGATSVAASPGNGAAAPTVASAAVSPGTGTGAPAASAAEWVDVVVQEMMSARDLDDARQRAAGVLQAFEAAAVQHGLKGQEREVQALRGQVAVLERDNHILKRAVAIQHERQRDHEARAVELERVKQMMGQYQEQLRKLEVSNYALSLHLQKAQVANSNSISNRFHPDVF